MPKITVDGKEIEVAQGATVMDAASKLGVYVPHFCYHRKLSIAANCRMCLVEVEKAPKPLPACATPATEGMKVWTHSDNAKKAQNGVMEFLLINHPLDCPICDQGGECQLQDLAVGYGHSNSRYAEEKRVVLRKELGPLVAAEEMSRCIQCTRCVRFGQEIAGVMELGLAGRGENAEIVSFVGKAVESELSGNMIDLCPVGALTSEPFRYKARTWELSRRKSIAPHDSLGANLVVQVKQNRVMRVLPLENDAINECWLSDKDRFSYEGLNSADRLAAPMIKRNGQWQEVDWEQAFDFMIPRLKDFGVLASPHATLEELFLAGRLGPADFRLRHADFSADDRREGIPWLGMPITEVGKLDAVLVIGSFLRKEAPLLAHRLRQAAKRGARVHMLHSVDDDWLMPMAGKTIVPPAELPGAIASFGEALKGAQNAAVLIGNFAQQHPQASRIHAAAQALGVRVGFIGEAANSVGGYLAGLPTAALPEVLEKKAVVLLNVEPALDLADPVAGMQALRNAEFVVALSPWKHSLEVADVLLPIAPFTESAGTFVNTEGRAQSFYATVKPLGEARPGWKVLRVMGSLLGLPGFDFDSIDEVRDACRAGGDIASRLSNRIRMEAPSAASAPGGIQRIADVPIYFADPLVRRSPPLQKTREARVPRAWMNARLMETLGLSSGQQVLVQGAAKLEAALDDKLPDDCVRIATAHPTTADVGPMFGSVTLEKVAVGGQPKVLWLQTQSDAWFGPVWGPAVSVTMYSLAFIAMIVAPLMLAVAYLTLWERKLIGWMQIRLGPNRVGPYGLFQPIADGVKLLMKEIILPANANKGLFILAPIVMIMPALAAWAVIPFAPELVLADINAGLLYILALSSLGVYGVIIAGWASNSKYAFLGAMRSAAQMVSYELAMGFALVVVLMVSGSLNLSDIVAGQGRGWFASKGLTFMSWNWLPLLPMLVVYFVSGVAETNRAPFDVVEGESEIVAGHMIEYSGMTFALFFLAEYMNMILISTLTAVLFFGGWQAPIDLAPFNWLPPFGWLLIKIFFIVSLFMWFRATFPRYRYDQIMRLGWKIFIPLTIVWIVVVGIWMQTPWSIWR